MVQNNRFAGVFRGSPASGAAGSGGCGRGPERDLDETASR
jgi:hypothetical protein